MKLSSVSVQAFRGVRDRVTLDISSAITVLYAPNGTGKTSICDAVEWLLTGQIDRLGIGLGDGAKELRCAFSSADNQVEVSATAWTGPQRRTLARRDSGAWEFDGLVWHRLTESALLEIIAPCLADENTNGLAANATRRGWLRGSRFLSGDSLALLVDSAEEFNEGRLRVFADLLGTRSLVDTKRKIDRYLQTMRRYIGPEQSREVALRRQVEELRAQLGGSNSGGEGAGVLKEVGSALKHLRELHTAMGESSMIDLPVTEREESLDDVGRAAARGGASLAQLLAVLSAVESQWSQRDELGGRVDNLSKRVSSLASAIGELQRRNDETSASLLANQQQADQLQRDMARLTSCASRIHQAAGILAPFVTNVEWLRLPAERSMAALYAAVPEHKKPASELNVLRETAERLRCTHEQWAGLMNEMSQLESRTRDLSAVEAEARDLALMEQQRNRLVGELQELKCQYETAAGAVSKLRVAAADAMLSLGGQSSCPVCSTKFAATADLVKAIESTLSIVPPAQATLAQGVSTREKELKHIEVEIDRVVRHRKEQQSVRLRHAEVLRLKQDLDARLGRIGLSYGSGILRDLDVLLARIAAAMALQDLRVAVEPLALDDAYWGRPYSAFIDSVGRQADQASASLGVELAKGRDVVSQLKLQLSKSSDDLAQRAHEKTRVEAQLTQAQSELSNLRGKWERVAGPGVIWRDEELQKTKSRLGVWLDLQRQAEAHLAAARQVQEYERRSKQFLIQSSDLEALEARLRKATAQAALADTTSELLASRIQSHAREQIGTLCTVVSPLFSRMQANHFFDRLQTGKSPLDWLGVVEGKEFSPDKSFSQGQRQDLALAIFMARARGLGGTFFMDEPLAHLDDLNRVALLDALRVIVVEEESNVNLVVTTANRSLVKHLVQKFARVGIVGNVRPLRCYELSGNARVGVKAREMT